MAEGLNRSESAAKVIPKFVLGLAYVISAADKSGLGPMKLRDRPTDRVRPSKVQAQAQPMPD